MSLPSFAEWIETSDALVCLISTADGPCGYVHLAEADEIVFVDAADFRMADPFDGFLPIRTPQDRAERAVRIARELVGEDAC